MAKAKENSSYELGSMIVPINTYIPRDVNDSPTIGDQDVENVLADITERMEVADGIMELHPDLNWAMELRTSMILSPNDMVFDGLSLKTNPAYYDNADISQGLLDKLETILNDDLDIDMQIPTFINESLFKYGAHIWFFLPPAMIDKLIEERNEKVSLEGFAFGKEIFNERIVTGLSFTDDYLLPFKDKINQAKDEYDDEVSMENYTNIRARPMAVIADSYVDRRDSSRPVVMDIPMDVCLPITNPSNPSEHQGYLILVDEHGHIVSRSSKRNYFKELADRLEAAIASKDGTDYNKLKEIGFEDAQANRSISGLVELFNETIVNKVMKTVIAKKGKIKNFTLEPDNSAAFYQIMFARYMKGQQTRMVYVPAKYIDYMAFDYDERGIGRSLLDKTKLYSSLRAILMFAELLGHVEASVPSTVLNITLDEKENDPHGVIQQTVAAWGQAQDRSLPFATFAPMTIVDELRRFNTKVIVDGGSKFPNTSMEEVKVKKDVPNIDSDIIDGIKKSQYAGLSVPPEAIDQALQGDFAINTYTNNLFFVKRSALDAKIFGKQLARRIQAYIRFSNPMLALISAEVGADKLDAFIKSIDIILPHADTTRLEEQKAGLEAYIDMVDLAIKYFFSSDLMSGLIEGDMLSGNEDTIMETYKAYFVRKYMADNNLLPELGDLINKDAGVSGIITKYNSDMLKNIEVIIKGIIKDDDKWEKRITELKERLDEPEEGEEEEEPLDTGEDDSFDEEGGDEEEETDDLAIDDEDFGDEEEEPEAETNVDEEDNLEP